MRRYCQRCCSYRTVDWGRPGTLEHCEDCRAAVAEGHLTPAQEARRGRRNDRAKKRRQRRSIANRLWANNYKKSRGCLYCPETDPCCLDLQHDDPALKEAAIWRLIRTASLEVVQKEVAKCVVICSNCHRKYHQRLREFGAPTSVPVRIKTKRVSSRDPSSEQSDRPPGFAEAMADLRRKCFPEAVDAVAEGMDEQCATEEDLVTGDDTEFAEQVVVPTLSMGAVTLDDLEAHRSSLIAELVRLDAEIASRQSMIREERAARRRRPLIKMPS